VHEAAVANKTTSPDANGNSSHVQVGYASAQNTTGKGEIGGKAGAGLVNVTINTGSGVPVHGQVNVQGATADANGHIATSGVGAGAGARLVQDGGQISFPLGNHTVTLSGTFSLIGADAEAHVDFNNGFSAGAGLTLLAAGASFDIDVTGGK
jgi:hypothetical protein